MSLEKKEDRVLLDRYHLIELVGSGAMGQVYRAEDKLLGGVVVAVKFLSQTLLNDKMRQRFETEATISALLGEKSIHIIRVRDYGIDEKGVPFYVMEFLEGQSLNEMIKFQPLPVKRFLYIARQICLGMDSAHSGIYLKGELCPVVHRDIKPSNISIIQDPTIGELVKILDFGIAKLVQTNSNQTHSFMGTLAYCSPEQMEGKELDNRSDIYSLGIMMYEMLTLEMPILPENSSFGSWYRAHHDLQPRPFEPHLKLPDSLKNIIMKCMAKSRDARPQSMGEILKVIDSLDQKISTKKQANQVKEVVEKKQVFISEDKTENVTQPPAYKKSGNVLMWPSSKPIQKIVFPRVISTSSETFTGLWVMLEKEDIENRISSIRYNQFLFLNSPHPMILWITVIYNAAYSARWLPCYLDLKTLSGQQVTSTLADLGGYRILFFAMEEPEICQHTMTSTIAPNQCKVMKEWLKISKKLPSTKEASVSKKRLKEEFQKLKPKILQKLEQSHK